MKPIDLIIWAGLSTLGVLVEQYEWRFLAAAFQTLALGVVLRRERKLWKGEGRTRKFGWYLLDDFVLWLIPLSRIALREPADPQHVRADRPAAAAAVRAGE